MRLPRLQLGVVAIGSGALVDLAYPSAGLAALAWVGLAPLLAVIVDAEPARAFRLGWASGFAFALGTLYWVVNPIDHYTDAPFALAIVALLLLAAVVALYTAAFAWGTRVSVGGGVPMVIAAPAIWVTMEWLRSSGPLGFPWAALGYSQYRHLGLVQMAEVTGVYGLSAVLVFVNAVAATVVRGARIPTRRALTVIAAVGFVAALWGLGSWRRAIVLAVPSAGSVYVGVVQANVDQARKWDPGFQAEAVGRHVRLTLETRRQGARFVVWPETAAPFYFQSESRQRQQLFDLTASTGVDLLFGSPAYEGNGENVRLLNRAYLVRRDGTVGGAYDKLRLVPFGEYVPLQPLLFFVDKMVEGVGDFASGREATVFTLHEGRFGVLICYEAIFPGLSRELVARGADVLVNITNDAWFGRTSAPHQHLAMVTLRAVENRVPVVRAANTGISAVIDVDGGIRWQTGLFEEAARADVVAWPRIDTVYTRFGDVFAGVCALASAAMIGYGSRADSRGTRAGNRDTTHDCERPIPGKHRAYPERSPRAHEHRPGEARCATGASLTSPAPRRG